MTHKEMQEFEREVIQSFRGEMRKLNTFVPEPEQNSGTVARVAMCILGLEYTPLSDLGQTLMHRYRAQRPTETLYSGSVLSGEGIRDGGRIERVSLSKIGITSEGRTIRCSRK